MLLEGTDSYWNAGDMCFGFGGEWVRFDTQTPYTVTKFRVCHFAGINETPRNCALYARYRDGASDTWVLQTRFTCDAGPKPNPNPNPNWTRFTCYAGQTVNEVELPKPVTSQDFKFEISDTYGSDENPNAGPCVHYINFFGSKDQAATAMGRKYERESAK